MHSMILTGLTKYGTWASQTFARSPAPRYQQCLVATCRFPNFNFSESWGRRGIALLMLGRDEEALESFRNRVLWSPGNQPRTSSATGGLPIKAGYEGWARPISGSVKPNRHFRCTARRSPSTRPTPTATPAGPTCWPQLKLLDAADTDYTEAIRLDPNHSRAFCGRGIVRSEQGRDELALADFDRAIALDPTFAKAYSYRGSVRSPARAKRAGPGRLRRPDPAAPEERRSVQRPGRSPGPHEPV